MIGETTMTQDSDYGYIQVFINFFKQILEIIMGLFKGGSTEEKA